MATTKKTINTVDEYIKRLEPLLAKTVETLRQIILTTDNEIAEQIKWNSPSFYYTGKMKPFDPKEYKRDLIVINLHKGFPLLVFPTGAKVKDSSKLLEGDYKDGRRLIKITDVVDAQSKKSELHKIIKEWLKKIDE